MTGGGEAERVAHINAPPPLLGDAGAWESGTWDLGTRGRRDVGLGDAGTRGRWNVGREDVINKQHLNFALNLQFTVFGG